MSVNKVFIMGNLGADPDVRQTPNNTTVCSLRIATNERRKDASGNWSDHTEWHSIVTFGATAENCGKYLKKGRTAFVEGRLQTRKWQDKEGKDRYTTEIVADRIEFIGGSRGDGVTQESSGASSYGGNQGYNASQSPAPMGSINPAALAGLKSADQVSSSQNDEVSFDDDDIPF